MPKSLSSLVLIVSFLVPVNLLHAQERKGNLSGRVTDSAGAILQGARIETDPKGPTAASDAQGRFTIAGLASGKYKVIVSYVGFTTFTREVDLANGGTANVDAVLQVASNVESITVRGDRQAGEVEALNRERTADNILQVLPAEVITSLPNTNVADAIGRLPSVSLERDEGEGKYIQIRGTEPRLSNVTVNGIHLPSPEAVRNVKLDVIPSDLVDSIEVSKTLSANQDADAIGGSANLVTKSPADQPYVTVLGIGGYTPISGGKYLDQFAGTAGQRFGVNKKFGLLFGGSYDYNERGINDVEPAPGANQLPNGQFFFGPNTADLRNYVYDRTRYGFGGEADYKLGDMSSVYFRGLYAKFNDFGQDWIYSPGINNFIVDPADPNNTCGISSVSGVQGCGGISFTNVFRQPEQQVFSVQAGARHVFGSTWLNYELALSQANYTGGYPRAGFNGPGSSDNSVAFGVTTSDPFTPQFPVLNGVNLYDPSTYNLSEIDPSYTNTFERDVVGAISAAKNYSVGGHFSSFEVGLKGWDARKSQVDFEQSFFATPGNILMSSFLNSFTDPNYYFGRYQFGPTSEYRKIAAYFNANSGQFTGGYQPQNSIPNDFDTSERIWAGYVMNTISFGRLRLQTGLRIESTRDQLRGNNVVLDTNGNFAGFTPSIGDNSYTNVFPSVQAQYRFGSDTVLRASYGIGIARPNFSDLVPFITFDPTSSIPVSAGNPDLKPTHAQNFDLLAEHYLKPVGILQAGVFYKYLTDPIYLVNSTRTVAPYAGQEQVAPINGPHAHIVGIETSWQQRLAFLPRPLNGMGVRANYSYTSSRASFPTGFGRTDHPTLLRTAPNNWNLDVTYDKKGFSARMGLTHNDGNIWSYGFQDGATGGIHGPLGDTYLYPHTQVDAQVSYWIPRGHGLQAIVSMLNLNNEVFGFYNGSEQFPIQREYYSRTISAGARWTLPVEGK
jgi:TonB-dependent receptor